MHGTAYHFPSGECGIKVNVGSGLQAKLFSDWISEQLQRLGPSEAHQVTHGFGENQPFLQVQIRGETAHEWMPGGNSASLSAGLNLDPSRSDRDLDLEILLTLLLSPVTFDFPSLAELISTIRIRRSIVNAARRTALAFATDAAERPADFWHYDEDRGFLLRPGMPLIEGLERATASANADQRLYTFSCRRATEYLVLLGLTREAETCNRVLFEQLHHQAETRALRGLEFERAFVRTIGSFGTPLPLRYFVPGDRTWFRNTDPISADVTGYEGSWTIYLGGGLFADFWRRDRVFTLESKLVCLYHWRNATDRGQDGELCINEARVDELIAETFASPPDLERILKEMLRLQSPLGTEGGGGIEPHREHPCLVHPETTDVMLPDASQFFPPK